MFMVLVEKLMLFCWMLEKAKLCWDGIVRKDGRCRGLSKTIHRNREFAAWTLPRIASWDRNQFSFSVVGFNAETDCDHMGGAV